MGSFQYLNFSAMFSEAAPDLCSITAANWWAHSAQEMDVSHLDSLDNSITLLTALCAVVWVLFCVVGVCVCVYVCVCVCVCVCVFVCCETKLKAKVQWIYSKEGQDKTV